MLSPAGTPTTKAPAISSDLLPALDLLPDVSAVAFTPTIFVSPALSSDALLVSDFSPDVTSVLCEAVQSTRPPLPHSSAVSCLFIFADIDS
jgi:hypothetical protein